MDFSHLRRRNSCKTSPAGYSGSCLQPQHSGGRRSCGKSEASLDYTQGVVGQPALQSKTPSKNKTNQISMQRSNEAPGGEQPCVARNAQLQLKLTSHEGQKLRTSVSVGGGCRHLVMGKTEACAPTVNLEARQLA